MTGPGRNWNSLVRWLKIETPVTSEGSRSGVNWMRLKEQPSDRAMAFASTVFPVPGTSSTRMWPRQMRATSASSTSWCLPKMTRSTFCTTAPIRAASPLLSIALSHTSLSRRPSHAGPSEHANCRTGVIRKNAPGGPLVHTRPKLPTEGGLHDASAERRGVLTTLGCVLQEDRDGDGGRVRGREPDEPAMGRAGRVLGATGLAGHFDARD